MKYVKSISLFFVYPLCCFLAGLFVGFSFIRMPLENSVGNEKSAEIERETGLDSAVRDPLGILSEGSHIGQDEKQLHMMSQTSEVSEAVYGDDIVNYSNDDPSLNKYAEMAQVTTTHAVSENEFFYIKNVNNYVVVYCMDQKTVFLSTGICVDSLPEEVQANLAEGICMPDEGSLYDFLENYTS